MATKPMKIRQVLHLPPKIHKQLRRESKADGLTLSEYVARILTHYWGYMEKENG